MKKLLTSSLILLTMGAMAQNVVLTKANHAFVNGKAGELKLTKYIEPGEAGNYQVWDFSAMEITKDLKVEVSAAIEETKKGLNKADIVLNEDGNKFFYKLQDGKLEMHGMENSCGTSYIVYDQPFVKMVYPFTFGDSYSFTYSGTKYVSEMEIPIEGTHSIEADGFGKLILPNGAEYQALRVKFIQRYSMSYENPVFVDIETYRWYVNNERFPLAVVQTICNSNTAGCSNVATKAAYNESVVLDDNLKSLSQAGLKVYPNPAREKLSIDYSLQQDDKVLIQLFDHTGKIIATLVNDYQEAGDYSYTLKTDDYSMQYGTYVLRSTIGTQSATKSFVKL